MDIAIKSFVFLVFGLLAFIICYGIALAEIWAINTVFGSAIGNSWKEVLAFMLIHCTVGLMLGGKRTRR